MTSPTVVTISPDARLKEALATMHQHRIRHLPVVQAGRLVGIVSDRDLSLMQSLVPEEWATRPVLDAMTPEPYTAGADTPVAKLAQIMAHHRYGCTVITDATGRVCGIFTTTDALSLLARWAPDRTVAEALAQDMPIDRARGQFERPELGS